MSAVAARPTRKTGFTPTWKELSASLIIDAPDDIRDVVSDAVSQQTLYYVCAAQWPVNRGAINIKRGLKSNFKIENGYHYEVRQIKTGELVWSWHVTGDEAREGWPYLSAVPQPVLLRHDEVAA